MTKNTIIRVDENNLIMLEIDTEDHSGQGGIMDAEGNFYPFSTVVSPTHSSVVRFEDVNVVLIKLDPDTHDSSAIIIDEVNGQVYPIGEPDPADNYQLMYQGNYSTGSTAANRVTLITTAININYGETLSITPDDGYEVFPTVIYGTGGNSEINLTPKAENQIYANGVNTGSHHVYSTNEVVVGLTNQSPAMKLPGSTLQWLTSLDMTILNSATTGLEIAGISFVIKKSDDADLTPEEAIQHVSWSIE